MPASSSWVDGLSVGPPSSTWAPSDANSVAQPGPGDDGERRRTGAAGAAGLGVEAGGALGDLGAHVGDVEVRDRARAREDGDRALGVVGVDVDLQRRAVADDEDPVADRLERADEGLRLEAAAGDGEVRALAEGLRGVLGVA